MPGPNRPLSEGKLAALKLLKSAYDDAEEAGRDAKQFALAKNELLKAGATDSDLRWLVSERLAEQLEEITRRGDEQRRFRIVTGLSIIENACFALTYGGKVYVETNIVDGPTAINNSAASPALSPRERIRWDCHRHELWVDGKLAKRFTHRAEVQWSDLDRFEDDGWQGPIEVALPGNPNRDRAQRLREHIAELNTGLDTLLIHFRKDPTCNRVTFDLPE